MHLSSSQMSTLLNLTRSSNFFALPGRVEARLCALKKIDSFLLFFFAGRRDSTCLFFLRDDTDSLFCGRWIFLRLPEIQWRQHGPLFMASGRCCRLHTSPLVSFYTFSLYRLIIRDVSQSSPVVAPRATFFPPALRQDTTATDNIYYETWSSILAFHARVFLRWTKRRKVFWVWWKCGNRSTNASTMRLCPTFYALDVVSFFIIVFWRDIL